MSGLDLKIDFSLDENLMPETPEFGFPTRMRFWDTSARAWLSKRGYTLFKHYWTNETVNAMSVPTIPLAGIGGDFPYAFHDDASTFTGANAHDMFTMGRVVFAQDPQHRHVALKLVRGGSEEARILHFLLKEQGTRPDGYIPGILPILDMLPFGGHWLAVMPRWGEKVYALQFNSLREVIVVVQDLLAGLAALHSFRIVHRDIAERNMFMNHFSVKYEMINSSPVRQQMRKDGQAKYVLYDFNHSVMLPSSTALRSCRQLCHTSWIGDHDVPDVSQGEYAYDPFAYDVWTLGDAIGGMFQNLIPSAPILAPLIAGMTTWDTAARLTAQQAQDFFAEQCAALTAAQLAAAPPAFGRVYGYDIWSGLAPAFAAQWGRLRAPPPARRRLLRWVCRYRAGGAAVRAVRRLLRL